MKVFKRKYSGGSVLIISLWLLVILSLLFVAISRISHFDAKLSLRENENILNNIKIFSGIEIAKYFISKDANALFDSPQDIWYDLDGKVNEIFNVNELEIKIEDLERKLDLNFLNEKIVRFLFDALNSIDVELDMDSEDFFSAYLDYKAMKLKESGNSHIDSIYEILMSEDFDYEALKILRDYFCITPNVKNIIININTVKEPILYALLFSVGGDELKKEDIYEKIIDFRKKSFNILQETDITEDELAEIYFHKDDLSPYNFLKKIGITADVKSISIIMQFLKFCSIDSKTFEVTIHSKANENANLEIARIVLGNKENAKEVNKNNFFIYSYFLE